MKIQTQRILFLTAALGLFLAIGPVTDWLEGRMEAFRFASLQPGLELEEALDTRYGHLALARVGSQWSLVADGRIAESFPDPETVEQEAAYVFAQAGQAHRVLVFGGLANGLSVELLRYPVERLDEADLPGLSGERLIPPRECVERGNFLTFRTDDAERIRHPLAAADVVVDHRADRLRFGFGVYQDDRDVEELVGRLTGAVRVTGA